MKLAHLILVHNEPKQLERLIKRLEHPSTDIYIHLDKKADAAQFDYLKSRQNVHFIKNSVKVYWGTFSIVQATINSFKEIAKTGITYQYINLLSGQDYPLKSTEYIYQYLNANEGLIFMDYLAVEADWTEALARIRQYHLNNYKIPGRYAIQQIINKILPQRKMPYHLIPVGRSQWFTIPFECMVYILNFWQAHPKLRRFMKLTWGADEFIFQTILYNSVYKSKMLNDNLRYIDWSQGGASPKLLTMADADQLLSSEKLFARKFDRHKDELVLNYIDKQLNP